MKYTCTRNSNIQISASEAIVKGISDDGGLFVPASFPILSEEDFRELIPLSFAERSAKILSLYMDDFSYEELLGYTQKAYERFDDESVCPVVKVEDGLFMLELWHGPTCAFKDVALTLLPYLLTASKKKLGIKEQTLILTATSGDTGKSALEGFKDIEDTHIAVFYPSKGVSELQRLQMVTQEGDNVHVFGIKGNFDDAQNAVKRVFTDEAIKSHLKARGIALSSANSINWGRLAPQIVYYISAYCDLVESEEIEFGQKVNFTVPTGNFGDALAGYYAYRMGLPINKIIIASNANNVLTDFFNLGEYDINRAFYMTMSPSMDILISSNLERLIYEFVDRDDEKVRELYTSLKKTGKFELDLSEVDGICLFDAGWADEEDTKNAIATFFDIDDYIMDTHTAVGASVYNDYSCDIDDETPAIVLSTANPYKFAKDVLNAIGGREKDSIKAIPKLYNITALECPEALIGLNEREEIHDRVIGREEIKDIVLQIADSINE